MNQTLHIQGRAAALRVANLDTDQIMPKQFLRGIDKAGLAQGLLYDMRYDAKGALRPDFVLNQPRYADTRVLIAGANFGCGSSREHAVWGLQQFGIQAVIAPSFAEIFYSNAMNNRLLLAALPEPVVQALMDAADSPDGLPVSVDIEKQTVRCGAMQHGFDLLPRHRRLFIEGLDVIGLSLTYRTQIEAFAQQHWARQPWLQDVARKTRDRLNAAG